MSGFLCGLVIQTTFEATTNSTKIIRVNATNEMNQYNLFIYQNQSEYYTTDQNGSIIYDGANNFGGAIGTNATSVLLRTFDNCLQCGILIERGNFILSGNSSLVSPNPGVTICGTGIGTMISTIVPYGNYPIILLKGANSFMCNFQINGDGQGPLGVALTESGQNDTISGMWITNGNQGINLMGNFDKAMNNYIWNLAADGIVTHFSSGLQIVNNVISGTTGYNGIALVTTSNSIVAENIINNTGANGIALENLGSGPCLNDKISNNAITGAKNQGIRVYAPTSNGIEAVDNLMIDGNMVMGSIKNGISIESGSGISVLGNILLKNGLTGIDILGSFAHLKISQNELNARTSSGIYVAANGIDLSINNNVITNISFPNAGIYFLPGKTISMFQINNNQIYLPLASYGIAISGNDSNGSIIGNTIKGKNNTGGPNGIGLRGSSTDIDISGNVGAGLNYGIIESSPSDYNTIGYNDFRQNVNIKISLSGIHFSIYNTTNAPFTYINNKGVLEGIVIQSSGFVGIVCNGLVGMTLTGATCFLSPGQTEVFNWNDNLSFPNIKVADTT
jgi:hypothetical protein